MWELRQVFGHITASEAGISSANAAWWAMLVSVIGAFVNACIVYVAVSSARAERRFRSRQQRLDFIDLQLGALNIAGELERIIVSWRDRIKVAATEGTHLSITEQLNACEQVDNASTAARYYLERELYWADLVVTMVTTISLGNHAKAWVTEAAASNATTLERLSAIARSADFAVSAYSEQSEFIRSNLKSLKKEFAELASDHEKSMA